MNAEHDGVYTFCLRWTGDAERALDLAVRSLRVSGPLAVYGEAARLCSEAGRPVVVASSPLPQEESARLQAALGAVGDDELVVLLLRDVIALDPDQVARALDLARGSVTARLQRARSALAARLGA